MEVSMRTFVATIMLAGAVLYACSEATDGLVPPDDIAAEGPDAAVGSSGSSGKASSSGNPPPAKGDGGTVSNSTVLMNEVSATSDWVEIVNSGTDSADIGGWKVADLDKTTNGPKLSEAATFPAGTALAGGAYALVQAGGLDAGKDCPGGGQALCVKAQFGVGKSGETLFLLASDGGIVGQVVYPPNAASGSDTWGRIPSGDPNGAFQVTAGTPGAANTGK
jgi:hypothetical protein